MHRLQYLSGDMQALRIGGEAMYPPVVLPYTATLPRNIVRLDITIKVSMQWEKSLYKSLEDLAKTGSQTLKLLKDVRIACSYRLLLTAKPDLRELRLLFQEQGVTFTWSRISD
jgi:hypothetical protein